MKETMNIAYFATEENQVLLEASIASLKANTKKAELNIMVYNNQDIIETVSKLEYSRVMVVSPYVFFTTDVEKLYNSVDEIIPAAGVRSAISNVGEVKGYIRDTLKINPMTYVSEQLIVLNLDILRKEKFFEKYEAFSSKKSFIYPSEEFINIALAGKIKLLDGYLAAPGQNIKNPSAVTYAYAGKPWEHALAEYSEIFVEYADLVRSTVRGQNIRQLAEIYKRYNVAALSNIIAFAM